MASKFKYNGVEHEEALGLNLYEMNYRQYDPAIARWTGIDPITHFSNSTYNAFDNNPVFWADPSGADSIYNWKTGQYVINGQEVTQDEAIAYANDGGNADGSNNNTVNEDCCGKTIKGALKGVANGIVDMAGLGWESGLNQLGELITGEENFQLLPRFEVEEGEEVGYIAGIILFAVLDPSPSGEVSVIRIVIKGGKVTKISKAVNSGLPHAIERAVERGVSKNADEAREALTNLSKRVGANDFPAGTIVDPSKADRLLVPFGNEGVAVYQVVKNGSAKLKTVLNKIIE